MKLRKFTTEDADRVAALVGEREVSKWTSNIPHPYSVANALGWIASTQSDCTRQPYAVEVDGDIVACVSYWPYPDDLIEVGYWVGKEYWGRGICTKALRMLMSLDSFPSSKGVVAKVMNGNSGSQGVLLKCGFSLREPCKILVCGKEIDSKIFAKEGGS